MEDRAEASLSLRVASVGASCLWGLSPLSAEVMGGGSLFFGPSRTSRKYLCRRPQAFWTCRVWFVWPCPLPTSKLRSGRRRAEQRQPQAAWRTLAEPGLGFLTCWAGHAHTVSEPISGLLPYRRIMRPAGARNGPTSPHDSCYARLAGGCMLRAVGLHLAMSCFPLLSVAFGEGGRPQATARVRRCRIPPPPPKLCRVPEACDLLGMRRASLSAPGG